MDRPRLVRGVVVCEVSIRDVAGCVASGSVGVGRVLIAELRHRGLSARLTDPVR